MNINYISDNNFQTQDLNNTSNTSKPKINIKWNGSGINDITGPTPFIDISKTVEENSAKVPRAFINTINLTGKIIKSGVGGIANVMSGISGLQNLFSGCPVSTLQVFCDTNLLFNASGVRLKDLSFNKTDDNWVRSADYSVSLEYREAIGDDDNWIEDKSESWTIEPLDDIIYTKFSRPAVGKQELYNPKLGSSPTSIGGGLFGSVNLQTLAIPQFRITRRLSAKGIPKPSGTGCITDSKKILQDSLLAAKIWVDKQSILAFSSSGTITIPGSPYSSTWLYNHNRTTNTDVYNATYEVNDSWLAMPTGMPYTETFSIDSSTDAENTKTVRVAGTIQGLSIMPTGAVSSSSGVLMSGTSYTNTSGLNIDLSKNLYSGLSIGTSYDTPSNPQSTPGNVASSFGAKYLNALSAWTGDVKPYIYRRACFAMRSDDRIYDPINDLVPGAVPPNPIFTKEGLLNVNPISTNEGHDPIKGTISYSYEYNNKLQLLTGVLSENIRITNTAPTDNIQEINIIGRALGPLLFSAGRSNPRKSISIDIVVPKPTGIKGTLITEAACPMYISGYLRGKINELVNGNEPFANRTTPFFDSAYSQTLGSVFKDSDSEDWNPTDGRYSRTVSWVYQQCTTDKLYLDH